jgi:hypothetical protein
MMLWHRSLRTARNRIIELTAGSQAELLHFGDAWADSSHRFEELRRPLVNLRDGELIAGACASRGAAYRRQTCNPIRTGTIILEQGAGLLAA